VQFEARLQRGLVDGTITACFRTWRRCQVVAGHRYRSPVGLVEVDAVRVLAGPQDITPADAVAAGYPDVAAAVADLRPGADDARLYLVRLHRVDEPDPRSVLAATDELSEEDRAELDHRLARLDRVSKIGPWTMSVLRLIEARPAVRAPDLAASLGRETAPFKLDVRKLKALGLTISLERGYRLSPRGDAYLNPRSERGAGSPSPGGAPPSGRAARRPRDPAWRRRPPPCGC
jgi:hypothetical protein